MLDSLIVEPLLPIYLIDFTFLNLSLFFLLLPPDNTLIFDVVLRFLVKDTVSLILVLSGLLF